MKLDFKHTARGFAIVSFTDKFDVECSLQKSSLATEEAIWFGCDDPNPRYLVAGQGWLPAPVPEGTLMSSRMHLTQDQVRALLPVLQHFATTGEVTLPPEPVTDKVIYHDN